MSGGGRIRKLSLPSDASGRIDSLLSRLLPGVPRRRLKEALRTGCIRADGRRCRASDDARPGALVEIEDLPDAGSGAGPARGIEAEILHSDGLIVLVEKPAGVPSYPKRPGEGGSVAEWVLREFPEMAGAGDHPDAPGLCHRLDLETSGLLLFARTEAAFRAIREQFRGRGIDKGYLAVVAGELTGAGTIDVPIGRRSRKRMIAGPPSGVRAWPARTHWSAGTVQGAGGTVVDLTLETGVTHQARVHMACLGHPIVGDDLYGGPPAERLALHACRLGFRHPGSGEHVVFHSREPSGAAT